MIDREKVIRDLTWLADLDSYPALIARDALTLLKEQEPVEPWLSYDGNEYLFHCTACDAVIYHNGANRDETKAREYAKFCRQCGRSVKWE